MKCSGVSGQHSLPGATIHAIAMQLLHWICDRYELTMRTPQALRLPMVLETLAQFPLQKAADMLETCGSQFQRACRQANILLWPHLLLKDAAIQV